MKEPHEKGLAIRSAPSCALGAVKCPVKRKQGKRWAGHPNSRHSYRHRTDIVRRDRSGLHEIPQRVRLRLLDGLMSR